MKKNKKQDQASTLREISITMDKQSAPAVPPRVISVTSGKGGVGKTNVVSNLAYIFSQYGKKVFVFDADIGLANIDVMLGLTPAYNLQHVFSGEKSIRDVVIEGPGGRCARVTGPDIRLSRSCQRSFRTAVRETRARGAVAVGSGASQVKKVRERLSRYSAGAVRDPAAYPSGGVS